MWSTYKKIWQLQDSYERGRGLLLLFLFLLQGVFDTIGVASIMPFMAVVGDPHVIETNVYLNSAYELVGAPGYRSFLVLLGVIVFIAVVGSLLFSGFTQWYLHRYTQSSNYRLSTRLLSGYYHKPYVWFLSQNSADMARTVLNEVNGVVSRSMLPAFRIVSKAVVVAFLVGLVVIADPWIAVSAATILTVLYAGTYLCVRHYLTKLSAETWQANEERFRITGEGLAAIKEVKIGGLESAYLARFKAPAGRLAHYYANQAVLSMVPKYVMEAFAFGGILLLLVFLLVTNDSGLGAVLPIIAVYAFAGYKIMPALQSVYHDLTEMRFGDLPLARIHDEVTQSDFSVEGVEASVNRSEYRMDVHEDIRLENVRFTYPEKSNAALDSVSLQIKSHTSVAFVGSTGAGKTTIVDIILGLLQPEEGAVYVDGTEISDANRRIWQNSLGYVPQQIFLADTSVAANIAFGVPNDEVDMAAVERAARIADLHEFVSTLPEGYQSQIGERGIRISGGQRQRIGIARALYHDPAVLILDEATSALDNITENTVMSAVQHLGRSKTVIMIAHRLSTVRHSDVIFMMDQGRIVASGTYDELMERSTLFREMVAISS